MEGIIEKLKNILSGLMDSKGPISLFALVKKEDDITWDLLVSGANINTSTKEDLNEIIDMLHNAFTRNEITIFSRLVLLNPSDPFVKNMNSIRIPDGDSYTKANNIKVGDILVKEVYLFETQPSPEKVV